MFVSEMREILPNDSSTYFLLGKEVLPAYNPSACTV